VGPPPCALLSAGSGGQNGQRIGFTRGSAATAVRCGLKTRGGTVRPVDGGLAHKLGSGTGTKPPPPRFRGGWLRAGQVPDSKAATKVVLSGLSSIRPPPGTPGTIWGRDPRLPLKRGNRVRLANQTLGARSPAARRASLVAAVPFLFLLGCSCGPGRGQQGPTARSPIDRDRDGRRRGGGPRVPFAVQIGTGRGSPPPVRVPWLLADFRWGVLRLRGQRDKGQAGPSVWAGFGSGIPS